MSYFFGTSHIPSCVWIFIIRKITYSQLIIGHVSIYYVWLNAYDLEVAFTTCILQTIWGSWVSIIVSLCLNRCIYIIGIIHLWRCKLWDLFKYVLLFLKFGFNWFLLIWMGIFTIYFSPLAKFWKRKNHVNILCVEHSSSCHPMCSQCFFNLG